MCQKYLYSQCFSNVWIKRLQRFSHVICENWHFIHMWKTLAWPHHSTGVTTATIHWSVCIELGNERWWKPNREWTIQRNWKHLPRKTVWAVILYVLRTLTLVWWLLRRRDISRTKHLLDVHVKQNRNKTIDSDNLVMWRF